MKAIIALNVEKAAGATSKRMLRQPYSYIARR